MSEDGFNPFVDVPERPAPRTTDDYLREREQEAKADYLTRASGEPIISPVNGFQRRIIW